MGRLAAARQMPTPQSNHDAADEVHRPHFQPATLHSLDVHASPSSTDSSSSLDVIFVQVTFVLIRRHNLFVRKGRVNRHAVAFRALIRVDIMPHTAFKFARATIVVSHLSTSEPMFPWPLLRIGSLRDGIIDCPVHPDHGLTGNRTTLPCRFHITDVDVLSSSSDSSSCRSPSY
jgi:hypothetical protein